MGYMDEYYKALESMRSANKSTGGKSSGGLKAPSRYDAYRKKYEKLRFQTGDIAPVKEKKDEEKLDFFQKGSFEDGYQSWDITKAILGTAGDAGLGVVKGALGIGEGLVDLIDYGIAGVADLAGADGYATELRRITQESLVDKMTQGASDYLDQYSVLGRTSDAILQGIGQAGTIMATGGLAAAGGASAAGVSALTSGMMGLSGMGSGMGEAYKSGATDKEAAVYGLAAGAADATWELLFGGMGKALNAVGFNKGLLPLDDLAAKGLTKFISSQTGKNFAGFLVKSGFEGLEELGAGFTQAVAKKLTYMSEEDFSEILKDENLLEQFIVGSLTSGMIQSGIVPGTKQGSLIEANQTGRDFVTGYSQNEQAVITHEMQKRIAEKEDGGKPLSEREKADIEADVIRAMEKGEISTDTIEEILGGNSYTAYRDAADKQDALKKELDELRQMKKGEMNDIQQDRLAELKGMNLDDTASRDSLKAKVSGEVSELVKNDRLAESYNEKARRGQKFEADLSRYDQKQRKIIQKAMDSGVVNNTNRSHEFVDLIAKICADKDIDFDFANNQKIKESGFAVEGAHVNGYVNENGVTINMQSAKALNTVVGHEVTHVLEGTKLYDALQQTVFEYARSKGELESRWRSVKNLYKDADNTKVNQELTADLIGDYLFTDADFINNLYSGDRNVFEKIYDEVKYLCKVATAGSKEARQLEKVKKAFADAYRVGSKAKTGTSYHVSEGFSSEVDKALKGELNASDQVKARDFTPQILVDNGVNDLPMLITQRHVKSIVYSQEEAKNLGLPTGKGVNYHGIGKDLLVKAIDSLDDPAAIYKSSENDYLVITQLKDAEGNSVIVPIRVDGKGSYNNVYIDENQIKSVYGKKNLDNYLSRNNFAQIYKKSGTALNEEVQYLDISNSTEDSLAQEADNVNGAGEGSGDIAPAPNVKHSLSESDIGPMSGSGADMHLSSDNIAPVRRFATDSTGRKLTANQSEYFKDSKVRDENGNLKVMYHGTPNGDFTAFRDGTYFTDSKEYADKYQNPGASSIRTGKVASNPKTFEVYLDIKKPFDIRDPEAREIYINEYIKGGNAVGINPYLSDAEYGKIDSIDWTEGEDLRDFLLENEYDYDGLVLDEGGTGGYGDDVQSRGQSYVVFNPEQVKNVDNLNPTSDPDVRYSISDDIGPVRKYGNYNVMSEEVYYDPTAQDAFDAPIREDVRTADKTEAVAQTTKIPATRKELHSNIIERVKEKFREKGLDFDKVLKAAKNLSTWATVDNTPQRVMEKSLGYKEGGILADITVNKVAQNETEGIKWLNKNIDTLKQISKQYHIKPGSKESAAAQMYAEGFYVDEKNNIVRYGERELAIDFPDPKVRANIKRLAGDPRIRKIYDDTLASINESRSRNLYPEIPRLDNYFLHFRAMEDTFSMLGLPFNPNDIRAKDLPTDLNGVTADLKPGQPYFASAMHRQGKRTSFDMLGGIERYLTSAKNQIYHIDDIQTMRALRNYIAETYGQAAGLENLDALSDAEAEERIKKVYDSHLSTFAKFLNEEANILAGKTALIDRGFEGLIGRRGITFLNTLNRQVGSNMVGYNISSSLTNFLPVAQTLAKTNKFDFVKAFTQTVANKVSGGKFDSFTEDSPVVIRRKGEDRFYRTPWQKIADPGYALMGMVDDISTEIIARTKYNELTRKGMDAQKAHFETDKWVSRLMGDRSLGQQPQLYNSKMANLVVKFQLEVRNQLDSQFYDTIQEAKASSEYIQNGLLRNAKKAAKITSTFAQLAVLQHLFGVAFESVAGYNPAFDIIEVLTKAFGWDDEEEDEDAVLDNLAQGILELLSDMPYTSAFTGGRIPVSEALPDINAILEGKNKYGNEIGFLKAAVNEIKDIAPYYILPGGYGQTKKTAAGLDMFSAEHPIAGSYADSGNLRFPVEDTTGNRIKAAIFGQYANENARDYFDNGRTALKEKQIQEFMDSGMSWKDYVDYREGLSKQETWYNAADYIARLDLPLAKRNILINNYADRKEPINLAGYEKYSNFEEFDWASKQPEKYEFLRENDITVSEYKAFDEKTKDAYDWAFDNPKAYELSKVITDDLVEYRRYFRDMDDLKADKDKNGNSISGTKKKKVKEYIYGLNIPDIQKHILFRSRYSSDDSHAYEIIDYLNSRKDMSYSEKKSILEELGFKVDSEGYIDW